MGDFFTALTNNKVLVCGISGWAIAQVLKTMIYAMLHREIRWERMVGDGGMPSAHSATVSAMATSAGILYGFGGFEFAIACMMAIIVMHDAMGVRMETGKQGKILNEMIDFFRTEGFVEAFKKNDKMYEFWEASLKEFVGHTPLQVAAGCILGICVACLMLM
ncbi:divergent PAP2 family protein [Clostridiaceae bacterium Marseille-Q4145]|nr:divergent PAP2 family protein [Clostridiaceae bacterium Marseille-Q4145]